MYMYKIHAYKYVCSELGKTRLDTIKTGLWLGVTCRLKAYTRHLFKRQLCDVGHPLSVVAEILQLDTEVPGKQDTEEKHLLN